jgi:hypothetical protein
MSPPEQIAAPPVHRGWLWAVRIAVLLGPVLFGTYVVLLGISAENELRRLACGPPHHLPLEGARIVGVLLALAASAPIYLYILVNLGGPRYRRGLALAVTTGWLALLISLGVLFSLPLIIVNIPFLEFDLYQKLATPFLRLLGLKPISSIDTVAAMVTFRLPLSAGFVFSQGLLAWLAKKTYRRETGERRIKERRWEAAFALGWFVVLFTVSTSLLLRPFPRDPHVDKIAGLMSLLRTSEETYYQTYKKGYSPRLADLGSPPAGAPASAFAAGLIDKALASGNTEGYTFDYSSIPGSKLMGGAYLVYARPNSQCAGPCYCTLMTGSGYGDISLTNGYGYGTAYDTKKEPVIMDFP